MISVHFREQKREDHLAGVYTIMLLNLKDALRDVRVYELNSGQLCTICLSVRVNTNR